MNNLQKELIVLRETITDMLKLVLSQVEKASDAFMNFDKELAEEVIHTEKKVNALELTIDKLCENTFALFNPVASDLRFTISALKMNSDIERIGDYADGIADYVVDLKKPIDPEAMEQARIKEMFDIAYHMLDMVIIAFETENTKLARKVFIKDKELNAINRASSALIEDLVDNGTNVRPLLYLFSTIKKMERMGDHIKNIGEDWIFYLEGEVLKHRSKKDKSKKG